MNEITILIIVIIVLILVVIIMFKKNNTLGSADIQNGEIEAMKKELENIIALQNRQISEQLSQNKMETGNDLKNLLDTLDQKMNTNNQMSSSAIKNVVEMIDKKMSLTNDDSRKSFATVADSLDQKMSNRNVEAMVSMKQTVSELETKLNTQNLDSKKNVQEIIERIVKLDAAQQQIKGLDTSINNLERVLNDKKARGTFGEIRLIQIFSSVFGENNNKIYEEQFLLPNGKQVDFMLHAPEPIGDLGIDSKFPLENYNNIVNAENKEKTAEYRKMFARDIKKHIDDISSKYIISGITSDQAMMFIPSESIFAEINAYHEDVVLYSYEKKVWITSPTTLMAILNLLIVVMKDLKRGEYSKQIHESLLDLKEEFDRYLIRWENLSKHIDTVTKDVKEIHNTSKKISKRFDAIEQVEISDDKQVT